MGEITIFVVLCALLATIGGCAAVEAMHRGRPSHIIAGLWVWTVLWLAVGTIVIERYLAAGGN